MGGIYTESRAIKRRTLSYKGARSKALPLAGKIDVPGEQVTTSYRSRNDLDVLDSRVTSTLTGHSALRERSRSSADNGHEFFTRKAWREFSHTHVQLRHPSYPDTWYNGPLAPVRLGSSAQNNTWPFMPTKMSLNEINLYGNRLINQAMPTNPRANALLAVIELGKDGLPSLPLIHSLATRSKRSLNLGSEYLNVEFGWKPLLNDIVSVLHALTDASATISAFSAGSGQVTRRQRKLPPLEDTTSSDVSSNRWGLHGPLLGSSEMNRLATRSQSGSISTIKSSETYSFSGAFTYYVDDSSTVFGRLREYEQKANHLLGLRLTPELLWNAMPWTWLVDWVFDINNAIGVASKFQNDGLVMKYGYLMKHTLREVTYSCVVNARIKGVLTPTRVSTTWFYDQKERVRATPFGFGVDLNRLNPRQWAILGALGLSQGPRSIR
nr:MAG: maturation protein [Leviviridae sp.]